MHVNRIAARTRQKAAALFGALLIAGASPVAAQTPLEIQRLEGPIELDGMSDEAAWRRIEPLPVTAHYPEFGAEPSERTEFLVAYDDEYLYAAGRMYDSDPEGIRAASLKRDYGQLNTDWFALALDTFNDKQTMVQFAVNPAGLRSDFVFEQDGKEIETDWDTFWDVAVERTDEGWFAEMRVPLSSLRFQTTDGRVVMGMTLWRHIARKNERMSFPAIEPNWGFRSIVRASQARDVVLEGVQARTAAAVTPYVLGGAGRTYALDEAEAAYAAVDRDVQEVGLSLKYGLTNNLTLDLTYNTDFAQVEADDQEINLTRFDISLPEKRSFFLERAGAFEFQTGDGAQLFYSRRIGIEDGRRVPILGGARLVGRVGEWDVGVLDMQTESIDGLASENFGVARVRRRVLNEQSYVGAIATSRIADGREHVALGADAFMQIFDQDYLTLTVAGVGGDAAPGSDVLDRSSLRARWERRGQYGLSYFLILTRVGQDFAPPIGFVRRNGHIGTTDLVRYGWKMPAESKFLRHTLQAGGYGYRRLDDGVWESLFLKAEWQAELKSGRLFRVGIANWREDLATGFSLAPGVNVPAGLHQFNGGWAGYSAPMGDAFQGSVYVRAGSRWDGWEASLSLSPTWHASKHLEFGGVYRMDHLRFPDRDQDLTTHLARLRTRVMLSTKVSLSGFMQYNSLADDAGVNLRLRYNPSEGNDLYLVFNEGLNTDRDGLSPRPPLSDRRTVMLKYSRAFRLELPR